MSTSAHAQQRALPVAPSTGVLRPLDLSEVQVTGGFWKAR